MKTCPTCGHDRLMHDSWGCKMKDCGVSIVYLTPNLFAEKSTGSDQDILDQGKALDAESDRTGESLVRAIAERSVTEQSPSGTLWNSC